MWHQTTTALSFYLTAGKKKRSISVFCVCVSLESKEKEDHECEACRSGSGCELTAGGAEGGWTSSETIWSQSGDGPWSGGETERSWKNIEEVDAGGTVQTNTEGENMIWLLNAP